MTPLLLLPTSVVLVASGLWMWLRWLYADLIKVANTASLMHPTWPVVGHLHHCIGGLVGTTELVMEMSMEAVKKGLYTTCAWMGPVPNLFFHHPNDVKILLRSCKSQEKFDELNLFKFAMGEGVLTASGDLWRMKRRHLNPLFHPHNLELLTQVFNTNSRQTVERLSERVGQGPLDILGYVTDSALLSICALIFGPNVNIDWKSQEFQGIKNVIKSYNSLYIKRLSMFWLRSDFIFELLYRKELNSIDKAFRAFTDSPLTVAMDANQKQLFGNNAPENRGTQNEYLSLVDAYKVMQEIDTSITTQDIRYEMMTLYFTGSETVGVAMSSCLLALAQHPDIQDKLYHEIETVVGLNNDVEINDLRKMPYLDQVMNETLRRFVIIPYIGRKTSEEMKLSSCTMPAGSTVYISILGTLMDPKQYPDPLRFNPDRFSKDESNNNNKNRVFMPFSNGSRKCIGQQYSLLLMKTLIAHIVRRFKLSTTMDINNLRRELIVALVSVDGYQITLDERR